MTGARPGRAGRRGLQAGSMDSAGSSGDSLAGDVVRFVSQVTDAARLRIEENLPHGFVRLKVAEAERRQAQHDIRSVENVVTELVRNSRDAGAKRVMVAFQKEQGRYRRISVMDDGCGIPEEMHQAIFEPRVTSKSRDFDEDRYGVHGRGMALFSIKSRCMSADVAFSEPGVGTVMQVSVDTKKLGERSDQATMPCIVGTDEEPEVGSGPHNVARVLLEMSVDHPEMEFYLGSYSEVLATARFIGAGEKRVPWSELCGIDEARALAEASRGLLGLAVSERNSYRILNDEITILDTVMTQARLFTAAEGKAGEVQRPGTKKAVRIRSPLRKLSGDDLARIGEGCAKVVEGVVGRYYLRGAAPPRVRRSRGKLIVSCYVTDEDGEVD